jgi:PleD family two-component response regulator
MGSQSMQIEENQRPARETNKSPARILIVEDNVEVRQICRPVLVERGFLVRHRGWRIGLGCSTSK